VSLFEAPHQKELREAGWHSRGYSPHFDGRPMPQFITLHLADSLPKEVVESWKEELVRLKDWQQKEIIQRRIEHYLDQGYGQSYLRIPQVAEMVQASLLKFNNIRYELFAWVVMPNHLHFLLTRFEGFDLAGILHSLKSYTAHEANKMLSRKGQFWWEEYFDRYIRDADHFRKTVNYIENNPVKAKLCRSPEDWPYSSAWYRKHKK
jgi:REP element-mobilizing transposase RayT